MGEAARETEVKATPDKLKLPKEFIEDNAPEITVEAIPECPVCTSKSFSEYGRGFDYELRTCRNEWIFVQCDDCDNVWLNPRPAVKELSTIYPKHYYAYDFEGKVNPIALHAKNIIDSRKLKGIFSKLGRNPEAFIDIGCGSGRYLRAAKELGIPQSSIFGMELDQEVVDRLNEEGYKSYCERVEDCTDIADGSIDLATMFHVIEHVDDPLAVVKQVGKWLRPDGLFAMETPNIDSFDARLFQKTYWGGYHIPRHWNLFSPKSIEKLLERSGLKLEAIQYQTGHSFWMYSMHHKTRYQHEKRGLSQWFDPLKGLPFLASFTAFDMLRSKLGFKTSSMLILARKA